MFKLTCKFIKWMIIFDYYFETSFKKLFKNRYKLEGNCQMCGMCCELIGVAVPDWLVKKKKFVSIIISFYEKVNEFKYQGYQSKALLFECTNYDSQKHCCKVYKSRPALCRAYPKIRFFEEPILLSGCSFRKETN